ncbi:MAG TPA: hypothetical protein VLV49_14040 [Terriglobales bacterium]|nr:hypothetical protein [Terriglobales bacterium]
MAGYSGKPLQQKLGIKPGFGVFFLNLPKEVEAELEAALSACQPAGKAGQTDFAMLFVTTKAELRRAFAPVARRLAPAGMLWVSWPKKASRLAAGLNENEVREIGLKAGLVDVKVCAVTEIWSGLKFVRRLKDR